jgi:hypothetical protein
MKTTLGGLMIGFSMLAGCAGAGGMAERGTVIMNDGAARAFVVGPAVVHAYSQDRGGRVFTTAAITGTSADCVAALAQGSATAPVPVDQVDQVTVGRGQVACVATNERRSYELLWHARAVAAPTPSIALARR